MRWNEGVSECEHVWMCACRAVVGGDKYCVHLLVAGVWRDKYVCR